MRNTTDNARRIKSIVLVAMFSALAFVTTVVCSYIPRVAGFLSLEFKDAVIVLCSLILGPLSGLLIAILVPIFESFTISTTMWYGLVMNILSSATFVLVTGTIYKFKRTFYGAIIGLLAGVFSVTAVMMIANLLITPLYLGIGRGDILRNYIPTILLPFNLIKALMNAAIVLIFYKQLSNILKKIGVIEPAPVGAVDTARSKTRYFIVTGISAAVIVVSLVIIYAVLNSFSPF